MAPRSQPFCIVHHACTHASNSNCTHTHTLLLLLACLLNRHPSCGLLGFGVPNRRKRIFILASMHGDARDVLLSQVRWCMFGAVFVCLCVCVCVVFVFVCVCVCVCVSVCVSDEHVAPSSHHLAHVHAPHFNTPPP
jgi:hypothetical protein